MPSAAHQRPTFSTPRQQPMTLFARNVPVLETDALAGKSVPCVGLGSGGATVADLLARSGVGGFVLWDHDSLEPHNVARHICTQRDLGRPKVEAKRRTRTCLRRSEAASAASFCGAPDGRQWPGRVR